MARTSLPQRLTLTPPISIGRSHVSIYNISMPTESNHVCYLPDRLV
jgi:hypothetical protein